MKKQNNWESSIGNKEYTILLVDDDPNNLKITGKFLKSAGYRVTAVDNSEKAVELLESLFFDVVITDMIMENIDGIELLKKVKALDKDTSVIVLTGYGNLASAVNAFRFGADDYLIKPWLPEEILVRISRCIENIERKRKHRQDFNNLLSVIIGNIEKAEDGLKPESGVLNVLKEARKASLRARALTKQLLSLSTAGTPIKASGVGTPKEHLP